jgi:hypothetical protein
MLYYYNEQYDGCCDEIGEKQADGGHMIITCRWQVMIIRNPIFINMFNTFCVSLILFPGEQIQLQ